MRKFINIQHYITSPFWLKKLALMVCVCVSVGTIYANPEGGIVTAGDATITQTGNTTTINQTSDKAIINWNSFNIGANEATHFQQPNSNSITLNRINPDQGASQIYGQLTSTGRIVLVNQAGIFFASGARVDVGGIIASTTGISDQNFLAGKLIFDQTSSQYRGSVINQGTIVAASNGLVALIGANVSNEGVIQANTGQVVLASGNKFTVDLAGDGLINFVVDEESSASARDQNGNIMRDAVSNSGTIIANGGKILLTAKNAQGVVDHVINMSGIAQAQSVSQKNGEIILSADRQGSVVVSGKINASGKNQGEKGGKVKILGGHIELASQAEVDVSGYAGGGEVLIGGNYQGLGPEPNALTTIIGSDVSINANALWHGDGGKVIIWGDEYTRFAGNITAQGGIAGGNGGFVETSAHYLNVLGGKVNTLAAAGQTGTWLLDPTDVTISNNPTSNDSYAGGTYTPTTNTANILASELLANLATSNVSVLTASAGAGSGDITVSAPLTWTAATTLTLTATRNIYLNADISAVNGGLVLSAVNNTQSITSGSFASPSATGVTANISVANFNLLQGQWYQNTATLPTFTVSNNFQLNSGFIPDTGVNLVFLRTLAGAGTTGNPYQLTDVYGLQGVATLTNSSFTLANNIDATTTANWTGSGTYSASGGYAGFIPIGLYNGTFDGNGHVISNLYQNSTVANVGGTNNNNSIGLFAGFGPPMNGNVTIKNLGLVNVNMSISNVNNAYYGPLVGSTWVTTGAVATIDNVYATGVLNVTGIANQAAGGGLIGLANSGAGGSTVVTNSYSLVNVNVVGTGTTFIYAGGFVGRTLGTNSFTNNYSTGLVNASGTGTIFQGGFMGLNNSTVATNNYWDSTTSGQVNAVGSGSSAGMTGLTTTQMMDSANFSGWDITSTPSTTSTKPNNVWFIFENATRPILLSEYNTEISTPHQLQLAGSTLGANYTLINDINLSSSMTNPSDIWGSNSSTSTGSGFVPIGTTTTNPFTGSFNGQNYTISNLYINRTANTASQPIGLFGAVSGSVIQNLGVLNANILGSSYTGALLGWVSSSVGATLSNLYSTGNVTNSNTVNNIGVGGLIGYLGAGSLSNSYSNATVSTSAGTANTMSVGGLVGILDSLATISNSYATGNVSGAGNQSSNYGGLIGLMNSTAFTYNSSLYSTGSVSGNGNVGTFIGMINGASGNNSINYTNYATALQILMSNQYNGLISTGTQTIANYNNIQTVSAPTGSTLQTPNSTNTITLSTTTQGNVNGPFYFNNITSFIGQGNTTMSFVPYAQINTSNRSILIDGVTYFYTGIANFSGNFAYVGSGSNSTNADTVTNVMAQFTQPYYTSQLTQSGLTQDPITNNTNDNTITNSNGSSTPTLPGTSFVIQNTNTISADAQFQQNATPLKIVTKGACGL